MFFEVSGLTKRFGGLTAVADMSFSIARGEIVGIFGPNGSGKTTLLNLIAGIYPPTDGRLFWKDRPLDARYRTGWPSLASSRRFRIRSFFRS